MEFVTLYWVTNTIERCIYTYRQVCLPPSPFNPPDKVSFHSISSLPPSLKNSLNSHTPSYPFPHANQDFPNGVGTLVPILSDPKVTPTASDPSSTSQNQDQDQDPDQDLARKTGDLNLNPRSTPLGFSSFPKEISVPPRSWAESQVNLVWYRKHDKVRELTIPFPFIHSTTLPAFCPFIRTLIPITFPKGT